MFGQLRNYRTIFFGIIAVIHFMWLCAPASRVDRRTVITQVAWLVIPFWAIVLGALQSSVVQRLPIHIAGYTEANSYVGAVITLVNYSLWIVFAILWTTLRWPFTKRNIQTTSVDVEASSRVIERIVWPLSIDSTKDMDIRISPGLYYTFIAGIFWVLFIVLETTIGEFLGEYIGSGYVSASIVAIVIAAAFYPLHKRIAEYVSFDNNPEDDDVSDFGSLMRAIGKSLHVQFQPFRRYWKTIIISVVLLLLIAFSVGFFFGWSGETS